MDAGLLVARLVLGLGMAAHGGQKLFGWFGGPGLKGTAGFMEMFGFRPGTVFALAVALGELGGGLLTAAGLFGPIGPALIVLVMIVGLTVVHLQHGYFAMNNGIEFPLVYAAAVLALASAGAGTLSLDHWLGLDAIWTPERTAAALVAGVVGAALTLAIRRAPQAAPANAH